MALVKREMAAPNISRLDLGVHSNFVKYQPQLWNNQSLDHVPSAGPQTEVINAALDVAIEGKDLHREKESPRVVVGHIQPFRDRSPSPEPSRSSSTAQNDDYALGEPGGMAVLAKVGSQDGVLWVLNGLGTREFEWGGLRVGQAWGGATGAHVMAVDTRLRTIFVVEDGGDPYGRGQHIPRVSKFRLMKAPPPEP